MVLLTVALTEAKLNNPSPRHSRENCSTAGTHLKRQREVDEDLGPLEPEIHAHQF